MVEKPRPSNMTRPIQAAREKIIEKVFEAMINENEEQRNLQLEYLQNRQLQRVKMKVKNKEIYGYQTCDNKDQNESNIKLKQRMRSKQFDHV